MSEDRQKTPMWWLDFELPNPDETVVSISRHRDGYVLVTDYTIYLLDQDYDGYPRARAMFQIPSW